MMTTRSLPTWPSSGRKSRPRKKGVPTMSLNPGVTNLVWRSEEHTSELQSQSNLVCRLLLEKKKITHTQLNIHSQTHSNQKSLHRHYTRRQETKQPAAPRDTLTVDAAYRRTQHNLCLQTLEH